MPNLNTSVEISCFVGKDLEFQDERRNSSIDPELVEMLEENQENRFPLWEKLTVGALKCHISSFPKQWVV